jgi:hypothetical protein
MSSPTLWAKAKRHLAVATSLSLLANLGAPAIVVAQAPSLGGHPKPAIDGHLKTGHHA